MLRHKMIKKNDFTHIAMYVNTQLKRCQELFSQDALATRLCDENTKH
jgi:hypothetical protein